MDMRRENGITLIALVIAVIIMGILASITVYTGLQLVGAAKVRTINTNMLQIQAQSKAVSEKNHFSPDENPLKGRLIGDSEYQYLRDAGAIVSGDKYYELSQDDLNSMGLNMIDASDGYLIEYTKEEVIYAKGYKDVDGNMHYRLSVLVEVIE